eukprot:3842758-Rhodomonas_salina.4
MRARRLYALSDTRADASCAPHQAIEKFHKMNDRGAAQASPQQAQLLWLVRELVALNVATIDKVRTLGTPILFSDHLRC